MRGRWVASRGVDRSISGAIGGVMLRHGGPPPRVAINFAEPYAAALPRDMRRRMMREIQQSDAAAPLRPRVRRQQYQNVLDALRAEPFVPEALGALVGAQAESAWDLQSTAQSVWLAEVSSMSAAERAAYADAIEANLKRRDEKRARPRE